MLFNGRALIFTYSRTQVRIAEHERLQSLFTMTMVRPNDILEINPHGRRGRGATSLRLGILIKTFHGSTSSFCIADVATSVPMIFDGRF